MMRQNLSISKSDWHIFGLLIAAVVFPSLLLSLLSFWVLRQQGRAERLAARQRAAVTLNEVDELLQKRLQALEGKLSDITTQLPSSANVGEIIEVAREQEPLFEQLFLLDAKGSIMFPEPPSFEPPTELPATTAWQIVQAHEFISGNLPQAVQDYRKMLARDAENPFVQNALARCYFKGENFQAAKTHFELLASRQKSPTSLRFGAYYQLIQSQKALGELESAIQTLVEFTEVMADKSESFDHLSRIYYFEQIPSLLDSLPTISEPLQARLENALRRWRAQVSVYEFRELLERELLPMFLPLISSLDEGKSRWMPLQNSDGWQVLLCAKTKDEILGAKLGLQKLQDEFVESLNFRLRNLGEKAVGTIIGGEEKPPESVIASLRPAPPISFWELVILSQNQSWQRITSWQLRLMLWASILCAIALFGGIILVGRQIKGEHELSCLKTDFVSNVSHELKTPLTSIRMFVETLRLKRYSNESEASEYLDILQEETERLTRLVNRVLDFSRMERGKRQFQLEEENLAQIVSEAVETFKHQLSEDEDCDITIDIEDVPTLKLDKDALANMLLNLLNNALKYSKPPKQIRVTLSRTDENVVLSISDNGIGIPKRDQKKVFQRFYRVNDTLSREVEGSGLGLSIVKYIADAHGASISVESKINRGSTFSIAFPL